MWRATFLLSAGLILTVLPSIASAKESPVKKWPRRAEAYVHGDIFLGALMMVHERSNETMVCGDVMPQGGVQAVEAMLYTLNWVNQQALIPHTKLGARILDDCDKDTYGLQQAVNFIKGRGGESFDGYVCNFKNGSDAEMRAIAGVVAAPSSITSIQVQLLLKLFHIPQVSFFSTSADLSDQLRYPYFFRTIPSDKYQVDAMRDIVLLFNWTYVSIIYEESSYGQKAYEFLKSELGSYNICTAATAQLPKDSDVAGHEAYVKIVKLLQQHSKAQAVIVYGSDQEVHGLMRAVRSENATGHFTWIGSDGWSARALVYQGGYEPETLGTISVQPMAEPIDGFKKYFQNLSVENHSANPWFYEFWEKKFRCRYKNFPETPYNVKYDKMCTGKEKKEYQYEKQLQFVSDAVLVFAYAIRNLFHDKCPASSKQCIKECQQGIVGRSKKCPISGPEFREYLRKVKFVGLTGTNFNFYGTTHDPRPNYNIIHFRRDPDTLEPKWIKVGTFTTEGLDLDMDKLAFYTKSSFPHLPSSRCSEPCPLGTVKKAIKQDKCCWLCTHCDSFAQFVLNETHCGTCSHGSAPYKNKTGCRSIPKEVVTPFSVYGIICIIFATIGAIFNTFILVIFVKNRDTPLVKASGRELSFVALGGLYLCFTVSALILAPPSGIVCGSLRAISGLCFVIVYASILTKANRITRIFQSGKRTAKRPSFISPKSQLVICGSVCLVHVLLVGFWFYGYPPNAIYIYPTPLSNIYVCGETVQNRYFLTYGYPIILCIICCVYAIKTRKMPEAFNESKYIGIAVYTTFVIWLAFVPVYMLSKHNTALRIISVCVSTNLTAYVVQIFMFAPKLWIILVKPEKNTRAIVMGHRGSSAGKSLLNSTATLNAIKADTQRSESSVFSSEDMELFHRLNYSGIQKQSATVSTQTVASPGALKRMNPAYSMMNHCYEPISDDLVSTATTTYQATDSSNAVSPISVFAYEPIIDKNVDVKL